MRCIRTLSRLDYLLGHKASINTLKKTLSVSFFYQSDMKLEISNSRKTENTQIAENWITSESRMKPNRYQKVYWEKKMKTQIPKLVTCSKHNLKRNAYSNRCLVKNEQKTRRSQVNNLIPQGIRKWKTNSPQKKEKKNKD